MPTSKKLNFEQAMRRLEEITAQMEAPDVSLERAIDLYTEGLKLARECHETLGGAEQKIKILIEKNRKLFEEDFEVDGIQE